VPAIHHRSDSRARLRPTRLDGLAGVRFEAGAGEQDADRRRELGLRLARVYSERLDDPRSGFDMREVLKLNAEAGYGDYRAPPLLQDDVADQYSFNNHALRRFNETVKDAIDPNGILSPGRGGIWPKAHRSRRGAVRK